MFFGMRTWIPMAETQEVAIRSLRFPYCYFKSCCDQARDSAAKPRVSSSLLEAFHTLKHMRLGLPSTIRSSATKTGWFYMQNDQKAQWLRMLHSWCPSYCSLVQLSEVCHCTHPIRDMFVHLLLLNIGYWKGWLLPDNFEESDLFCLLFLRLFFFESRWPTLARLHEPAVKEPCYSVSWSARVPRHLELLT